MYLKEITQLRQQLERRKGQRLQIEKAIETLRQEIKELTRDLRRHEQAREIIREVGLKTQQQLSYHISDITSLALEAVSKDPYQLVVEFVQRRNKTECDLYFQRAGNCMRPEDASGGGVMDVAALALRVASWSMQRPRSASVIILDEPFKFLHGEDNQRRAAIMVKELAKRLNLQFIIVTQESILASYADRVFEIKINKGVTKVSNYEV